MDPGHLEVVAVLEAQRGTAPLAPAHPRRLDRIEARFAFWLILPTLVAVLALTAYPLVYSLWLSLHDQNPITRTDRFVGLGNFVTVLKTPAFWNAVGLTGYFALVTVVGGTLLGLVIALVLNQQFPGRSLMRSLVLVPWAMSSSVVGFLWAWIYDGGYGTLNGVLYSLGLIDKYIPWLNTGWRSMNLVAVTYVWNAAPLAALLLLAQLQTIPRNLYNAARTDGANSLQQFFFITLPALRPALLLVLIIASINSILAFDLFYMMTWGGPGSSTTTLAWLGYLSSFKFMKFGEGTAILYLLTVPCLVLAAFYYKMLTRGDVVE